MKSFFKLEVSENRVISYMVVAAVFVFSMSVTIGLP